MESILDCVIQLARQHVDATSVDAVDDPDADLRSLGLTSLKSVQFLLSLERTLDVSFPEHLLDAETFRTPRSVAAAVSGLRGAGADAEPHPGGSGVGG